VRHWLATVPGRDVFVTVVSQAEIAFGVALLPEGHRKEVLREAAGAFFKSMEARTLAFGSAAALSYGEIMAARRRAGQPMAVLDAQIAA
jgi:predicted nucleic acid-binding protein